jgi:hypothetical protein
MARPIRFLKPYRSGVASEGNILQAAGQRECERWLIFRRFNFTFVQIPVMAVIKTQSKTSAAPRKAAQKKAVPKKGSLAAIEESVKFAHKHKLDFSYIQK